MTGRAPLLALFALTLLPSQASAKGEPIPLDGTPRKGSRSEVSEARDSQLTVSGGPGQPQLGNPSHPDDTA